MAAYPRVRRTMLRACATAAIAALILGAVPGTVAAGGIKSLKITGNTVLTADVLGPIVIAADGVTLDCAGYRVIGSGVGKGIALDGRWGVTVRNCDVSNFATGIWVSASDGVLFEGNASHDNRIQSAEHAGWVQGAGVWVQSSTAITFGNNRFYSNPSDGFDAFNSSWLHVYGNDISDNALAGVFLGNDSTDGRFIDNTVSRNGVSGFFVVAGASDNLFRGNDVTDNVHWGFEIGGGNKPTTGNTFRANEVTGNGALDVGGGGFRLGDTADNVLEWNYAFSNRVGIALTTGAASNTISYNIADGNTVVGFAAVSGASFNVFSFNTACGHPEPYYDAFQDGTTVGNVWTDNTFCMSVGI